MTRVPDWMLPEGMHDVARHRVLRDYGERRKGGRVLTPASWAEDFDRLTAEHEAHKRRIGEVGAMLDRIERTFGELAKAEQGEG